MRALLTLLASAAAAVLCGCTTVAPTTQPAGTAAALAPREITLPLLPSYRAPADPTPLTQEQVLLAVSRLAPGALLLTSDAQFSRVNYDLALELIDWSRALLARVHHRREGRWDYVAEAFDCDKFAKAFTLAAEAVTGRAGVRAQPLAARVFVVNERAWGGIPAGSGHAVVAIGTDRGILIVEPQTGAHTPLEKYPNRHAIFRVMIGG